jgi:hypothetical protein
MQQSELQALGQHIQAKLQQLPNPIRLRIRCAFREEALLVLAEHLLHVEPDARQTFITVEEALQDHTPELMKSGLVKSGIGGTRFLPVRIYLRIAGYQQPYDTFVFSLKPATPAAPVSVPPIVLPPPVPQPEVQVELEPEPEVELPVEAVSFSEPAPVASVASVASIVEIEPVVEAEPVVEIEPVAEVEPIALTPEPTRETPPAPDQALADFLLPDEITPAAELEPAPDESIETEPIDLPTEEEPIAAQLIIEESIVEERLVEEPIVEELTVEEEPAIEEPIVEEPIELLVEEPIVEEPIVEEPIAAEPIELLVEEPIVEVPIEEPIVEEQLVEERIGEEPIAEVPVVEEPIVEEPIAEVQPIVEELWVEEPIAEEPIAEELSVEDPVVEASIAEPIVAEPIELLVEDLVVEEPIIEEPIVEEPFVQETPEAPIQSSAFSQPIAPFYSPPVAQPEIEEITEPLVEEPPVEEPEQPEILNFYIPPQPETIAPPSIEKAPEPAIAKRSPEGIAPSDLTAKLYPPIDDPTTHIPDAPPLKPPTPKPQAPKRTTPKPSASTVMMGTAIALFTILGGWYVVTRPCVLGSTCEPLEKAQQISQSAFQTVQTTDSAVAIAKAYDDIAVANKLLKSIPSWSGQHRAAQDLLIDNEARSTIIGQLVRTLQKANEAANRSQNPPHPLPEWREIQRLWRESIAALEKIPSDDAIYPVAQRKALEYRANLETINKRVIVEQQAQEEVENAKKTAQLAETRTGIATSVAGWQDVYTSWQAAIDLLKNVPRGSAAHLEAEELLKIYQAKLTAAATRRDQESTAIAAYTEAIAQAEQAQSFEKQNQWQSAIDLWESALANLKKVNQGTTPYAQAQPLIATYQAAFTAAQSGLRISEAIQAAKPALDRTCGGNPKVCQYDSSATAIRVQITYGYDAMVESAMTSAQTQGNYTSQAGVISQVNTFLQDLSLISQSAQVPIELYNANGSKFGTYTPGTSGFSAQ